MKNLNMLETMTVSGGENDLENEQIIEIEDVINDGLDDNIGDNLEKLSEKIHEI